MFALLIVLNLLWSFSVAPVALSALSCGATLYTGGEDYQWGSPVRTISEMIPRGRFSGAFITHSQCPGWHLPGALGNTVATHKVQWGSQQVPICRWVQVCEDFILFPSLFEALNWPFSLWKITDVLARVRTRCVFAVDADRQQCWDSHTPTDHHEALHTFSVCNWLIWLAVTSQGTSWGFFKR